MEFKTQFDSHERVISNPGNPIKTLYGAHYDDDGRLILEEKGKENLYDFIQSHAESVDIHCILKRFENGETDALSRVQGFYADVTNLPTTYAGMLNHLLDAEEFFKSLPVETRSKFNNSFSEFLASSASDDFLFRLGVQEPVVEEKEPVVEKKEEVKE